MSDEDPTWKHKRDESQRRRDRMSRPGTAIVATTAARDDLTSPVDLFERDLEPHEAELIEQSQRNGDDPATYADVVKLAAQVSKARSNERSNNAEREAQLDKLLTKHTDNVKLTETVAFIRKALVWVAIAAGGSLVSVGVFLYTRGFSDGGDKNRLSNIEKTLDELRSDVRESRRWPMPSTKKDQSP